MCCLQPKTNGGRTLFQMDDFSWRSNHLDLFSLYIFMRAALLHHFLPLKAQSMAGLDLTQVWFWSDPELVSPDGPLALAGVKAHLTSGLR